MALVQWCSGYLSFLAAPLAAGYYQVLNREQLRFESQCGTFMSTEKFVWLAYRPGRTPVGYGRVRWYLIVLSSILNGAGTMV